MTDVKPIRQKSLWDQHDMLGRILEATEQLLPYVDPRDLPDMEQELEENRTAQVRLRQRAEKLEGVRHE